MGRVFFSRNRFPVSIPRTVRIATIYKFRVLYSRQPSVNNNKKVRYRRVDRFNLAVGFGDRTFVARQKLVSTSYLRQRKRD